MSSAGRMKTREHVVSMALHLVSSRHFGDEHPEAPHVSDDIDRCESALDDVVKAHARRLGMVDPGASPERSAPEPS